MKFITTTIGKIANVKGGKRLPKGEQLIQRRTSHPYIRAQDIRNGNISISEPLYVTDEIFKRIKKYTVQTNDVCIVIVGANVGDVGIVPPSLSNANLTENAVKITELKDFDPSYLRYCLITVNSQEQMKLFAAGAAQPKLGLYKIREIEIPYPLVSIQRKIAAILSAYDDLIENNTRRIQILEEMAQSLYRHWFVDYKFPGHEDVRLVDSGTELGLVPEGWVINTLGDFGDVITGKTPSKNVHEYWDSPDIQFIRLPDMHNQFYCIETTDTMSITGADSQSNKYLPSNSLCVSCIGTVGIVTITAVGAQTNQQINSIVLTNLSDLEFLFFALLDLKNTIQSYSSSGATMANLSRGKFIELSVTTPIQELRTKFHETSSSIFEQIKNLQYKNANLHITRNLLLPKLVSGELDVSELDIPLPAS